MQKPNTAPNNRTEQSSTIYRLSENPYIAKHFSLREFQCSDGTPILLLDHVLVDWLDYLRDEFGPVRVNSGYRTHCYNEKIGGASDSRHLYGLAADVVAVKEKPETVANWAEEHNFGGIGRYHRFTHLDVWSENRRWDNR